MTPLAIVTMILVCGIVWGGFGFFLLRALRSESRKRSADTASPRS